MGAPGVASYHRPVTESGGGAREVRSASFAVARVLPRAGLGLTIVVAAIIVIGAALSVVFIVASGIVVGSIPGTLARGLSSPRGHRLVAALATAAGCFVIQQLLGPLKDAVAEKLGRRVDGYVRRIIMRATLTPPGIAHLEEPEMLDRISLAQGVGLAHVTPGDAVIGLAENAGSYLQMIGGAWIVALFNPLLAAGLVAANLFVRSQLLRETGRRVQVVTGQSQELRRSNYFRDLALTPDAAKETRIFGMGPWILDRFRSGAREVLERMWAERKKVGRLPLLWFVPGAAAMLVSFYLLGRAAVDGSISLSAMAVTAQAVLAAGTWFVSDSDLLIQYGGAAVGPAVEVASELHTARAPGGAAASVGEGTPIVLDHVSFGYPGRAERVFDDLNLRIEPRRSLAIVGRNGSGKTTLVKLLCRLYDPLSGAVRVDDVDLRSIDPRSWRSGVAAIFQDFVKYELPATANVGFGALHLADDRSALEHAARRAGALDAIEGAPDGWDSPLSREYRDGVELSGGQWQRIALARALLAVDGGARLLILDEPTANLDVRAEAEVFDAILREARGTTIVLVSHRFSTVRKADLICVLEDGRVVEIGAHDELMERDGHYAHMFRMQAAPFAPESETAVGSADD
jgi:ATP-binding cassette, subfamily B, bacterial